MIFKRRFGATLLVLLCGAFAATESSDDFKFDSDDLQVRPPRPTRTDSHNGNARRDELFPTFTDRLLGSPGSRHETAITLHLCQRNGAVPDRRKQDDADAAAPLAAMERR